MLKINDIHPQELFVENDLLDTETVNTVRQSSKRLEQSFLRTALNFGYLARKTYYRELREHTTEWYDFEEAADSMQKFDVCEHHLSFFLERLAIPVGEERGKAVVVVSDPSDAESLRAVEEKLQQPIGRLMVAEDLDLLKALHTTYGGYYLQKSVFHLYDEDPESCAIETFTKKQLIVVGIGLVVLTFLLYLYPYKTLIAGNLMLNALLFFSISFKFLLTVVGSKAELTQKISKNELAAITDEELPVYTVLLPIFKESEIIQKLIWNLQSLHYPREKLDIKLLIESNDDLTYQAVKDLEFPAIFDPVIVPPAQPKTKPKACNYGLYFCRGELLTIYDAEDVPDSDQLKSVYRLFQKLPEEYVVIQCALNYFNKSENFLTRMFTLEYSYWFDYMLPGLDRLKVPIPLGGTSNHFKFDKLMELGGWDAFNVTEDADLGLRAYAKRYKVTVLDSTTYEEANNEPFNWIRQRSRWIKGYMQTYLVHMRRPFKLLRNIGFRGFFGFQFFIGGTFVTFLTYPILLSLFLFYLIFPSPWIELFFPEWLLLICLLNLTAGNLLMIYTNMIAIFKRRMYTLISLAVMNPFYWLMHSIAAYKGLGQLITKPFYWEKTTHGLTKVHKK